MRKILALILAVMMIASLSLTAFAANTAGGEAEIAFSVDPTYIITIPQTVSLAKTEDGDKVTYENDYEITAEAGVRLKKDYYIEVAIVTDNVMETKEGATLAYEITKGGAALVNNVVATFVTDKAAQTSKIHISADDPEFAGDYKDTVTFTVAVKTDAPALISFTLNGKPYQAEAGMTLCQWAESSYDVEDEYRDDGNGSVICSNGVEFLCDDEIVDGEEYYMLG